MSDRGADDRQSDFGDPDAFYSRYYQQVLRTGIVGSAQDRTHRALERRTPAGTRFARVLEVGAGKGEHFDFVQHDFEAYVETDIRAAESRIGRQDARRAFQEADAQALPFDDASFDRVIATCLLLHLPEPETALREWRRVAAPGAVLNLLVPCDPGAFVRSTRQVLTVPAVRRSGFRGYKLFNARDHRNHVGSIDRLVKHTFRDDHLSVYRFPFGFDSWNLNAYFVYDVIRAAGDEQ